MSTGLNPFPPPPPPPLFFFPPVPPNLSSTIPFSLASLRLLSSLSPAARAMPLRIAIGIFSCVNRLALAPSACSRMSVARWRVRPSAKARVAVRVVAARLDW